MEISRRQNLFFDKSYKAFISYKHTTSSSFAENLELAIKRYAKPLWHRPMAIFRDEKYLQAGVNLSEQIQKALESSEFLIYLASPEAAKSPWVQDELNQWCANPERIRRLIIVLTDGEIIFDKPSNGDSLDPSRGASSARINDNIARIDWNRSDALPDLSTHLRAEPVYVDLSWANSEEKQTLLDPDYKKAINLIVATVRRLPPVEMSDIAINEYRKGVQLRNIAVSTVVLLLVAVSVASAYAWNQKGKAENRMRLANAQRFNALSEATRSSFRQLSALFAVEAVKSTKPEESPTASERAVRQSLDGLSGLRYPLGGFKIHAQSGDWVASQTNDNTVQLWDISINPFVPKIILEDAGTPFAVSNQGHWMVTKQADGTASLTNLTDRQSRKDGSVKYYNIGVIEEAIFSDNGRWLAVQSAATGNHASHQIQLVNLSDTSHQLRSIYLKDESNNILLSENANITFSPNGNWLAVESRLDGVDSEVRLWNINTSSLFTSHGVIYGADVSDIFFSPNSRWMGVAGRFPGSDPTSALDEGGQLIHLWDLESNTPTRVSRRLIHPTPDSSGRSWLLRSYFTNDSSRLVSISDDDSILLSDLSATNDISSSTLIDPGRQELIKYRIFGGQDTQDLAIDPNGLWLAAAKGPNVVLWNIQADDPVSTGETIVRHDSDFTSIHIDPTGRWLVAGAADGTVRIWDLHAQFIAASERLLTGHQGPVHHLNFDRKGRWLLSYGRDVRINSLSRPNGMWDYRNPVYSKHFFDDVPLIDNTGAWFLEYKNTEGTVWALGQEKPVKVKDIEFYGNYKRKYNYTENFCRPSGDGNIVCFASAIMYVEGSNEPNFIETLDKWDLKNNLLERRKIGTDIFGSTLSEATGVSPDGRWALYSERKMAHALTNIFDSTRQEFYHIEQGGYGRTKFSSDSRWLVTYGYYKEIFVRDLWGEDPGKVKYRLELPSEAGQDNPGFDVSERWLVVSMRGNGITVFDLLADDPSSSAKTYVDGLDDANGKTLATDFTPDGQSIIVRGVESSAFRLWTIGEGRQGALTKTISIDDKDTVSAVAVSKGLNHYAVGSDQGHIYIIDVDSDEKYKSTRLPGKKRGEIVQIEINSTGEWLAWVNSEGHIGLIGIGADNTVMGEWTLGSYGRSVIVTFSEAHSSLIVLGPKTTYSISQMSAAPGLGFSEEYESEIGWYSFEELQTSGRWALVSLMDGALGFIDLKTNQLEASPAFREQNVIKDGLGGWLMVVGTEIIRTTRWSSRHDTDGSRIIEEDTLLEGVENSRPMALGPNKRWLVTGYSGNDDGNSRVRLWDLAGDTPVISLISSELNEWGNVLSASFGPTGRWLVVGYKDGTIRLIDLLKDTLTEGGVTVLLGHQGAVNAVSVGSQGRWMISGDSDGVAFLWGLESPNIQATSRLVCERQSPIKSVAIGVNGEYAVVLDENGVATFVQLSLTDLVARVRQKVGRNFTKEEWKMYFGDSPYCPTFPTLPVPDEVNFSRACASSM